MRKTKEVLRLRFELGLGLRQIARSCSLGLGTIHDYLRRAKAAAISWPLPEGWDEEKLEAALFGATQPRPTDPDKATSPYWSRIFRSYSHHWMVGVRLRCIALVTKSGVFAWGCMEDVERLLDMLSDLAEEKPASPA